MAGTEKGLGFFRGPRFLADRLNRYFVDEIQPRLPIMDRNWRRTAMGMHLRLEDPPEQTHPFKVKVFQQKNSSQWVMTVSFGMVAYPQWGASLGLTDPDFIEDINTVVPTMNDDLLTDEPAPVYQLDEEVFDNNHAVYVSMGISWKKGLAGDAVRNITDSEGHFFDSVHRIMT